MRRTRWLRFCSRRKCNDKQTRLETIEKDVPILCLFVPTRNSGILAKSLIVNGGDDGTRTRGLCRDSSQIVPSKSPDCKLTTSRTDWLSSSSWFRPRTFAEGGVTTFQHFRNTLLLTFNDPIWSHVHIVNSRECRFRGFTGRLEKFRPKSHRCHLFLRIEYPLVDAPIVQKS